MKDTAKQIIKYWYSLECLQPKEVPKYKAIPKKYIKELIFKTENDTITIYQQSVIKPYWKRTNSRVSTYVVPLPNDPYIYSITDEIKYFKDDIEKDVMYPLKWKNIDSLKQSEIIFEILGLNFDDDSNYDDLMHDTLENLVRLKDIYIKYLKKIETM